MRLGVLPLGVVHVVGGDERQVEIARELDENPVEHRLLRQPVILQLDVQRPRLEDVAHAREDLSTPGLTFFEDGLGHDSAHAAGQCDDPLGPGRKLLHGHGHSLNLTPGHDADQVAVALGRRRQERQVVAVPAAPRGINLASEDGVDLRLFRRLVEGNRAKHVAVIGDGDGGHSPGRDTLDEVLHLHRSVEKRILRVNVQVDELGGHRFESSD